MLSRWRRLLVPAALLLLVTAWYAYRRNYAASKTLQDGAPSNPLYPVLSQLDREQQLPLASASSSPPVGYVPPRMPVHFDTTHNQYRPSPARTVRRPCGEHMERNQHFVDRKVWQSIKPGEMTAKRGAWQHFVNVRLPELNKLYDRFQFQGRGIVYTASGATLPRALTSIQIAREHGCTLPVEIWYLGDEWTAEEHKLVAKLSGVTTHDLLQEQSTRFPEFHDFEIKHTYGASRNYHIKSLVLLLSRFQEILYLDSDNNPLRDPTFLFDTPAFQSTGAMFWPDYWKFPIDNPMWQITGQHCEDEWEQESGQLVLDKRRAWSPLLVSMFFQMDHRFYFRIILGDKDTFRFAWKVLQLPYYMVQQPASIAGRIRQGRFCGHTMIQHDPEGSLLFAHTTALKTTSAIREGITWEALQYFQRTKPIPLESQSPNTQRFLVSYPVVQEYTGGAHKLPEQGGAGAETRLNPCLDMALANVTMETTVEAVKTWGEEAVDNFRIVTENWQSYNGGAHRWFENSYYKFGGVGSSANDASCGNGRVGNGKCANHDECCSSWGWCGDTLDHCGAGCAGGPCFAKRTLPSNPSPSFEYCGDGKIGYGVCKDPKACCSRFGWCGTTEEFCKADNCISGKCLSKKGNTKK